MADLMPFRRPTHEIDFLPAALEIIERPASPAGRALTLTLCALVAVAVLWASVGNIDIIATAPGRIIPVGNSKQIQPLEAGIVTAIRVSDGDHVTKGQVLIELDSRMAKDDSDRFAGDRRKARLEVSRLNGLREMIAGRRPRLIDPPTEASPAEIEAAQASLAAAAEEQGAKLRSLDQQILQKDSELKEAQASIDKLSESLPLVTRETEIRRELLKLEYSNKIAALEQEQKLIEAQHDLQIAQHKQVEAEAALMALRQQRGQAVSEFEKTVLAQLADAESKASESGSEQDKAALRLTQQTLTSPIDGTVQQLDIHTVGGVVTPAQALAVIVPDDSKLIVEAHVTNQDIGFVRAGQDAEVKIEAFSFTRYGLVAGRVVDISRDAVLDNPRSVSGQKAADRSAGEDGQDSGGYVAHIALDRAEMMTEGGAVALTPGMSVMVEIKTGKRKVIDYLLSPVLRYRQDSMRER